MPHLQPHLPPRRNPSLPRRRPSLLRRHDYNVEVAGGFPAAQYVYDIVEADGLRFPTKRRAYLRGPGLKPIRDLLLVSIDLSNFRLR